MVRMINQKFNRLRIIQAKGRAKNGHPRYLCSCDCGQKTVVDIYNLKNGNTKSCGCLQREKTIARNKRFRNFTHRATGSPEVVAYHNARRRCEDTTSPQWKDYGGRGIQFLFTSVQQWLNEAGLRPSPKHTIDRRDNNRNYEPGNIRWATRKEQTANRRPKCVS